MMCETVPQAISQPTQEVDVGQDVYWQESMLTSYYAPSTSHYAQSVLGIWVGFVTNGKGRPSLEPRPPSNKEEKGVGEQDHEELSSIVSSGTPPGFQYIFCFGLVHSLLVHSASSIMKIRQQCHCYLKITILTVNAQG